MGKILKGTVVSDKAEKTIVVQVNTQKVHPVYKKRFASSKKYHAHDESNQAKTGDSVTIAETLPISKNKRWKLVSIDSNQKAADLSEIQSPDVLVKEEK